MNEEPFKILVVEDDESHAGLIRRVFQSSRDVYRLSIVGSLTEARVHIATEEPDLVITDVRLPDGLGTELLPHSGQEQPCAIVIMTSFGNEQVAVETMKAGALDYVVKSPEMLLQLPHIAQRALREWGNIVRRRQAEKALQESERRFRDIALSSGQWVWEVDDEGRYTYCSEGVVDVLGYELSEILGRSPFEFMPEDEASRVAEAFAKIAASRQPIRDLENRNIRKDGSEVVLLTNGLPVLDCDGNLLGYRGVDTDITQRKRIEQKLRESQERQRAILDNIPDIAWLKDKESRYIAANEPFGKSCGFSPEELVGKTDFELWPHDLAVKYRQDDMEVMTTRQRKCLEEPIQLANGQRLYLETIKTPIFNERGETIGTTGISRDISRRKQTEEQLQFEKSLLEAQTEASIDGILVIDSNRKSILSNRRFGEMWGIPREIIDSRDDVKMIDHVLSRLKDPDSFLRKVEDLYVHWEEGSRDEIELKDGRIFDRYSSPLLTPAGNHRGRIWFFRDITELKRAQQEQARLAEIIEQASEIVIVADLQHIIEYVNPAFEKTTGFTAREVLGRDVRTLYVQERGEMLIQGIEKILDRGEEWSGTLRTKKKDGSAFNQELSVWAIRDSSDETTSLVSVGRDVTERLALERQLSQAQKLESIGQLAAGIAHEINTPMQYVGDNTKFLKDSFAEITQLVRKETELLTAIKEGNPSEELAREVERAIEHADLDYITAEIPKAIEQSLDGIERVTRIVRAMKEFSHPGVEAKVATDINKAIESTITVSRNEWKYVAEMVTDLDPALPMVPCFPGEFNQAVLNLITNGAHAIRKKVGDNSSEKGKISISTKRDDKWVEVVISDTGTGIPEEVRERVFDPFFTTKEVGKGTGQGLSICRAVIVEKHEGTIRFETETGVGTSFIIRLPLGGES